MAMDLNDQILNNNMGGTPEQYGEILEAEYSNAEEKSKKKKKRTIILIATLACLAGVGTFFSNITTPSKQDPAAFPLEAAGGDKSSLPPPTFNSDKEASTAAHDATKADENTITEQKLLTPATPITTPTQAVPVDPNLSLNTTPLASTTPSSPVINSPTTTIQKTSAATPVPSDLEKRILSLEVSMGSLNEKLATIVGDLKKQETLIQKQMTEIKRPTTPAPAALPATKPAQTSTKPSAQPDAATETTPPTSGLPTEAISAKAYGITAVMTDGVIYSKDGEDREINIGGKVPGLLGKLVITSPSGRLIVTDKKIYRLN